VVGREILGQEAIIMATIDTKNNTQIKNNPVFSKQHQSVHGHMRYIVNAVGQLDLQSCALHIAEASSLRQRIALYRRSLYDLQKALQRDTELNEQTFIGSHLLENIVKENQKILFSIVRTQAIAENALNRSILREELNVALVKINLAVNAICETINLKMIKEDALARIY
jgi:hypothetical protein